MVKPCDNCQTRKMYAHTFDMHIGGEDCPYECEEYEIWKTPNGEAKVPKGTFEAIYNEQEG